MTDDMTTGFYMLEYIRAKRLRRMTATQLRFAHSTRRYYGRMLRAQGYFKLSAINREKAFSKIYKCNKSIRELNQEMDGMRDVFTELPPEYKIINDAETAAYAQSASCPTTPPTTTPGIINRIADILFQRKR